MTGRTAGIDLLIRKLERFEPLPESARLALRALPLRHQDFSRGQIISNQGVTYRESAIVVSGLAVRYKVMANGQRQIVAVQVPGDFADLQSLVIQPLDHSLAAVTASRIARVPHTAILQLLKSHPDLCRWLIWDVALESAISREWLTALGRRSAYQRLAHLFCELYFRLQWSDSVKDDSYGLPLSQTELADACGISAVHVNRSLQMLRRGKLIVLENRRLTVLDMAGLMQVAAFDLTYLRQTNPVEEPASPALEKIS